VTLFLDDKTDKINAYGNTKAFDKFNKVSTSFSDGLERSIVELAKKDNKLLLSDVFEKFGNYPKVHKSVNKLLLKNEIIINELEKDSFVSKKYNLQEIRTTKKDLSKWVDLSAQPCLTCPIFNECELNNPVSPANCDEFETWLHEEIELKFGYDPEH